MGTGVRVIGIDRWSFVDKLETWVEFIAIGMIGNEKTTNIIDDSAQFFDFLDATDVLLQPKRANMSPFGGHFDTTEQDHSVFVGVFVNLRIVPSVIMFSDAQPFKPNLLRLINHRKSIKVTIGAATGGVSMEVNAHAVHGHCSLFQYSQDGFT
jgi:hypothetical protein